MVLALLLPVLASGVAAQHLTLPLVDYGAVVDAVNPNDPGYQICTDVAQFVSACVVKAGGTAALSTANPVSLAECACCVGTTDVAPAYSSCANYLVSEAPQLTSQISAYGYFYSACGASPQLCLGNSGGNSGGGGSVTEQSEPSATPKSSQPQSPPPAASTSIPSPASSPSKIPQQTSATGGGSTSPATTGSAASAVTTLAPACTSMVDIFEQCTKNTPGFTNLVFSEQAYCYCCRTELGGEVTWTDEIDTYASTCRDWAVSITTGDPLTAYDVAKTFATFCQHFSDACAVTTNGPSSNTNNNPFPPPDSTGSSGNGGDGGQVTVTVTRPPPTTTSHNAAPTARAGLAAGALAIAGFAIMI
ncbi:hypothetical protein TASIC1_0008030600 [Trichoderma asperellum]|uniref:Uncharacterized protein n=1 Tax=Trichoderma asperellum TaxID=101201 RepID=A0A6V8QZE6_TRIAP|nr:hypothetical protein TASIC1_0008030600 [Trichoderma asperellum]